MFSFIKKIFNISNASKIEEPDIVPSSADQMHSYLITNASSDLGVCCILFSIFFHNVPR